MLSSAETVISTQYHQLMAGGGSAALMGLCKAVLPLSQHAKRSRVPAAKSISITLTRAAR